MAEAKAALDEAVTAIEASAAVYDVLADALRYAGQVKDWYEEDEEKRGKMETAIQAAQEVWENTEQTEEQIRSGRTGFAGCHADGRQESLYGPVVDGRCQRPRQCLLYRAYAPVEELDTVLGKRLR